MKSIATIPGNWARCKSCGHYLLDHVKQACAFCSCVRPTIVRRKTGMSMADLTDAEVN